MKYINISTTTAVLALAISGCVMPTERAVSANQQPAEAEQSIPNAETSGRYVHAIDMSKAIPPFLSPEGYMDPAFPRTVASPSAYLADFYGAQAIKDLSRADIIADFVPRYASVVTQDENSVTLKFKQGFTTVFYPGASISAVGQTLPIAHATFEGERWPAIRQNIDGFLNVLSQANLTEKYLVPNALYATEKEAAEIMEAGKVAPIIVDPDLSKYEKTKNAILLLPEAVHGKLDDVNILVKLIESHDIDWVGMEMLPPEMQPALDAFVTAPAASNEYRDARSKLLEYFKDAWNGRAGPKVPPEDLGYFKILEKAREHDVRIIGIEETTIEYLFFRYGETFFGGSVRSYQWAKNTPQAGRGVLFGGKSHYNQPGATNVQDYVHAMNKNWTFFSQVPIEKKKF